MENWYEKSFGEDYLLVYKHRDMQGAETEVRKMIEWLKLPNYSQVLDLCCGMGRHALALAEASHCVTGVDLSLVLLKEARASDPNNMVRWIHSDMRSLPCNETFYESFDAVVNLFTSFGYFEEDSEQIQVLKQIYQSLKPSGRFIIDYLNASFTVENLVLSSEKTVGENLIIETRDTNDGFVRKKIVVKGPSRETRQYTERVKLYSLDKLTEMLDESGLVIDVVYGNYDEGKYEELLSPRMIIVGHRK